MPRKRKDRYLYRRNVTSAASGRVYVVSFDPGRMCWMCACPGCTRRNATCKHLEGCDLAGPSNQPLIEVPPSEIACPSCNDPRMDTADLVRHMAEQHPSLMGVVIAGRYSHNCACGFSSNFQAMCSHLGRSQSELGSHFAKAVMIRSTNEQRNNVAV